MTIRSQISIALLAAGCAAAQPADYPLTRSCAAGSEVVATLQASDQVKVRYSFAGDNGTCYAVTATVGGKAVDGYLSGSAHPAIAAFERDVRTHATAVPVPPPPPAPAPAAAKVADKPAAQPAAKAEAPAVEEQPPISFAGFRAVDINGDRVDLSRSRAPTVVVYFWSARSKQSIRSVTPLEALYDTYHTRGVDMVGIGAAANRTQLIEVSRGEEFIWPQVFDTGGIASRYHVDPSKPFLVLDQSRKVIAAVPTASAVGPVLDQLTKNRRPQK